jgi:hypothetical protein
MHRKNVAVTAALAAIVAALSCGWAAAADANAEDRAAIENLMGRYLFALDFRDPDAYAATFTEDGTLNHAGGIARGRQEIRNVVIRALEGDKKRAAAAKPDERPIPGRHFVTNVLIEVEGDKAKSKAYWTYFGADENRRATASSFGTWQDELVKQNGKWLFSKKVVFNEFTKGRQYGVLKPE